VEHIDKNGKPLLYLVFEYLDTDLKKYIDAHGRGTKNPLPTNIIKVRTEYKSCNTQFSLHWRFGFFLCVFAVKERVFTCLPVAEDALRLMWVQSFMYQLCKGVAHCHSHGVMHRYIMN
jgi:cyclin-dependent kinase